VIEQGRNINKEHLKISIQGIVQGVGFRPFVLRLAKQYQQHGWIANTQEGVTLAVEGYPEQQRQFLDALNQQLPAFAEIKSLVSIRQPLANFHDFQIQASISDGKPSLFVLPDIAVCPACLGDIHNPDSRFYRYPFTSCCQCGPRYSVMCKQPYDRAHTSMAGFALCPECRADYRNADDRRFHAQTLACPRCGPQLSLLDGFGQRLVGQDHALVAAVERLRDGNIIAVKGIGGYQLLVDAGNQQAVERLRERKHRPHKPFALMVADIAAAQQLAVINAQEQPALCSAAAPIVLLQRKPDINIANAVAPDSALLGIMLAYSPLHHLLLDGFAKPLVATSGNRNNEPICIGDTQAMQRLAGIADYFLTHDRAILRPLDDSIVRLINGKITVLRRARGYAPLPITLKTALPDSLAVGGQLKNTVAISHERQVILSQHLGDLESEAAQQQFQATIADLQDFYQIRPMHIQHDLHKGYNSSQLASALDGTQLPVQHHYAHALSCMAEHGLDAPALAIVWDGSGLGDDNSLWGGEFLLIQPNGYQRYAHLRTFSLPGGYKAMQEPRRAALGLLYEIYGDDVFERQDLPFSARESALLKSALNKQINCPRTSSAGRLFDAVASLLGLCQINHYEGQAAMALESLAADVNVRPERVEGRTSQVYEFIIIDSAPLVIDWQVTLEQLLSEIGRYPPNVIATKFHNTLAAMMLAIAERAGQKTIILSGGCMQNACLVEKAVKRLETAGFNVYCHEKIPPNDGGLALGQIYAGKFLR